MPGAIAASAVFNLWLAARRLAHNYSSMHPRFSFLALLLAAFILSAGIPNHPAQCRKEKRLIDLHQHINSTPEHLARAVKIMDEVGIGVSVNLSGGVVTRKGEEPSEFERNKKLADQLHPGRFLHYMNLDYKGWNTADFGEKAAKQIEEGHRLGAAGLKEYKRLGLYLRDGEGNLIKIDDPKLDPVWKKCGELGMPVSIHVADPRAFWLPYNSSNERWVELKDHRPWWFGDTNVYPPREELLAALNRVIEKHSKTIFVCVHFANNAEDIDWVEKSLDKYPNMYADLAARIPEIGRHPPEKVRRLFTKHQDRIFFATDFQVYNRLTLGSGGSGPPPTDEDAINFFKKHWQWLETNDRNFAHMTPIQGNWTINAIGLPNEVLRKIYFDNARRLLKTALPLPQAKIPVLREPAKIDGKLNEPAWTKAALLPLEYESFSGKARLEMSTAIRAYATPDAFHFAFEAPYTKLSTFPKPDLTKERIGLWENDVVEIFMGKEGAGYKEFEIAPSGEKLDLRVELPEKDFVWSSNFETAVDRDAKRKIWTTEIRIPRKAFTDDPLQKGEQWRVNFYRFDKANKAYLAWSPTYTNTFHSPTRFGSLRVE